MLGQLWPASQNFAHAWVRQLQLVSDFMLMLKRCSGVIPAANVASVYRVHHFSAPLRRRSHDREETTTGSFVHFIVCVCACVCSETILCEQQGRTLRRTIAVGLGVSLHHTHSVRADLTSSPGPHQILNLLSVTNTNSSSKTNTFHSCCCHQIFFFFFFGVNLILWGTDTCSVFWPVLRKNVFLTVNLSWCDWKRENYNFTPNNNQ